MVRVPSEILHNLLCVGLVTQFFGEKDLRLLKSETIYLGSYLRPFVNITTYFAAYSKYENFSVRISDAKFIPGYHL